MIHIYTVQLTSQAHSDFPRGERTTRGLLRGLYPGSDPARCEVYGQDTAGLFGGEVLILDPFISALLFCNANEMSQAGLLGVVSIDLSDSWHHSETHSGVDSDEHGVRLAWLNCASEDADKVPCNCLQADQDPELPQKIVLFSSGRFLGILSATAAGALPVATSINLACSAFKL